MTLKSIAAPVAIEKKARQIVQSRTGWSDFELHCHVSQDTKTSKQSYLFWAYLAQKQNGKQLTFWLNQKGEEIVPEAVEIPKRSTAKSISSSLSTITISPDVNILTLNPGETFSEVITANIPDSPRRSVDIYFLGDTTGSMSSAISSLVSGISSFAATMLSTGHDIQFGVGDYKDFPSDIYAFQHQQALTNDMSLVNAALGAWFASGGSDTAEGQFYALYQLGVDASIGWRPGSIRIVVWLGDAPAHDPVCNAYSGVGDIDESVVIATLISANIHVVAASVGGGLDNDPIVASSDYTACGIAGGAPGQAGRITLATGGAVVDGMDMSAIEAATLNIINTMSPTINWVTLVPTGGTAPFVTGIYPHGYGPIDTSVPNSLPFDVAFTGVAPCGSEPQVFTGTIDLVVDDEVVAQKTVEITVPPCDDATGKCPCDDMEDTADSTLSGMAADKYFTIPSAASSCVGLPTGESGCTMAELPRIQPCFFMKWGDGPRDQFETEDFEVVMLSVCNPYRNVEFGCIELFNLRVVNADGSPVELMPDGTPVAMIVPGVRLSLCGVGPCECVFQEIVLKTCGAKEGAYAILFEYCIDKVSYRCVNGRETFPIELWRS